MEEVTAWMQELDSALRAYMNANDMQIPSDLSKLAAFVTTPAQQVALRKLIKTGFKFQ